MPECPIAALTNCRLRPSLCADRSPHLLPIGDQNTVGAQECASNDSL